MGPQISGFANVLAVKIWSLGSSTPNFQLEAHETKGVNHVDYYPHSDKPYLLTTSDDVSARPCGSFCTAFAHKSF